MGIFGIDGERYEAQRIQASISDKKILTFTWLFVDIISLKWEDLLSIVLCFFYKLHIFDDSSFSVVFQLVLDPFLLNKSLPVQLALSNWINLATSVINSSHDVIEVLKGYVSLSPFKFFIILLSSRVLKDFIVSLFLYQLQLPSFLIHYKLFACKDHSFVWLKWFTIEDFFCHCC